MAEPPVDFDLETDLVAVSDKLKEIMKPDDETFRLFGDEFVVLHKMESNVNLNDTLNKIYE